MIGIPRAGFAPRRGGASGARRRALRMRSIPSCGFGRLLALRRGGLTFFQLVMMEWNFVWGGGSGAKVECVKYSFRF